MPRVLPLFALLAAAGLGRADDPTMKFMAVEPPKADYLVPVVAPQARALAVSAAHGWAAVGHRAGQPVQLSLFRLDAQGKPTGNPVTLKTPRPDHLAPRNHYVLGLVFHPRIPLLYVWQDVEAIKADPPPEVDPAWTDFDHLLVYNLDGPAPELVLAACRGDGFCTGVAAGTPVLDAPAGRLFVPNTRLGGKKYESSGIGIFHLEADGLPSLGANLTNGKPAPAPVLDSKKAAADRPGRVAALRAALAAGKPIGGFWCTPVSYGFSYPPCGAGIVPLSSALFAAQGSFGLTTWDEGNRRARCSVFMFPIQFAAYYVSRLAAHPVRPVFYVSVVPYSYFYCVEHIDGRPTQLPQTVLLEGAAPRTAPVVLTHRNLVALGGPGCVYLVPTDPQAKIRADGPALQVNVPNPEVDALCYSERYDRLYVAVDKKP